MATTVRLYVDHPLGAGQLVPLSRDQVHYLAGVMRKTSGEVVAVFNGRDGEWRAELALRSKKAGDLHCVEQSKHQLNPPDLWLLFAPIKKARTDFIVEKAAEMGVARIFPVQTDFTNAERIRVDRLQAHAVEAAEQCGGIYVPVVEDLQKLEQFLARWPKDRRLMFCDEGKVGQAVSLAAHTPRPTAPPGRARPSSQVGAFAPSQGQAQPSSNSPGPWAILIGPEGGFSEAERRRLLAMEETVPISLGPRILRADTAAVAALTLWQMQLGDWG